MGETAFALPNFRLVFKYLYSRHTNLLLLLLFFFSILFFLVSSCLPSAFTIVSSSSLTILLSVCLFVFIYILQCYKQFKLPVRGREAKTKYIHPLNTVSGFRYNQCTSYLEGLNVRPYRI